MADFLALLPRTTTEAAELAAAARRQGARGPRAHHRRRGAAAAARAGVPQRDLPHPRAPSTLLREHDVACVLADTAGRWPKVEEDTSDFRYVRLHGDRELYASGYTAEALDAWAARAGRGLASEDVFVYFDNDAKGCAPHDAMALIDRVC